ncbi:MAG: PUA domain-containing protein [Halobacteriaceae archaeon]
MSENHPLSNLRTIADYQFRPPAGAKLFQKDEEYRYTRTRSERIQQVSVENEDGQELRICSVGRDGRLTLGFEGGRRLLTAHSSPKNRVIVGDESRPYVKEGRNVFAKFVIEVDEGIRSKDEVAVVHKGGSLLAVGRAEIDASAIDTFESGMAVKVRKGKNEIIE